MASIPMHQEARSIDDWECPYCRRRANLVRRVSSALINLDQASQPLGFVNRHEAAIELIECPNPDCKEVSVRSVQARVRLRGINEVKRKASVTISPTPMPAAVRGNVPSAILDDRCEAYAILELSPKSAATLARRALQGAIRHAKGIKRATLAKELRALKGQVDPALWDAMDAVRQIAGIAAHMERDVSLIVEVEPQEAERLLQLLELVIDEWYAKPQRQAALMKSVSALALQKKQQRAAMKQQSAKPASP